MGLAVVLACCCWPALRAQPATASAAVYSFDIPPQPLSSALEQFARQSRREILFTPSLVAGKRSPGVAGTLSAAQALDALLKGCGIVWSTTSADIILLHEQPPPPAPVRARGGGVDGT
ncbi:hypothetical protein DNK44_18250 [Pseudomonas dryadis]|uniref:Secretin/TonB short N-terminal domain-containing protein n=2 Tax=Phytopseudomonas dryadis TaxID=2487520 RepID=A0A4Q9QW79_9GAMM|nr:hypothetical protein DNK44_18250 [Pseudomonas dryadis]